MKAMRTIITGEESYSRKVQKRREAGMRPMEEYNAERWEQTEDKLWQVQTALERYPNASVRKLAEYTGLSRSVVARLIKKYKSVPPSVL